MDTLDPTLDVLERSLLPQSGPSCLYLSSKKKKKEEKAFVKRFPFTFYPKNTLPYQVWRGCNEEETAVREKEKKEKKGSKETKR